MTMRVFHCAVIAGFVLLFATASYAHRVNVFAWVEGSEVHVESEFSRGNPVKGGGVEVRRVDTDEVLASGATDDTGLFVFALPEALQADPANLEVMVKAGQGHLGSWTVRAQDYAGPAGGSTDSEPAMPASEPSEKTVEQGRSMHTRSMHTGALDAESAEAFQARLEEVIEHKLDEKLTPLVRAVNRMQEDAGPSMSDVFGGIGYLIGLAGLVAYFKSRREH